MMWRLVLRLGLRGLVWLSRPSTVDRLDDLAVRSGRPLDRRLAELLRTAGTLIHPRTRLDESAPGDGR